MTGVLDPGARSSEVQKLGISQVLNHRNIDEELIIGALWDDRACQSVQTMHKLGLDMAVADGVDIDFVPKLCRVPIYTIIVGRGIPAQPDPAAAARTVAARVKELWLI